MNAPRDLNARLALETAGRACIEPWVNEDPDGRRVEALSLVRRAGDSIVVRSI